MQHWNVMIPFEPSHDKTNNVAVRPAKTQISLGICPVWSESSLSTWRKLGSLATHWVPSEDSDQTGRMPRLIWVFAGRTLILLVLSCRGSFQIVSFIMLLLLFLLGFYGLSQLFNLIEQVGRKWKILKKNNLPTRKQILACPSWAQTHSSEMTTDSER